MDVATLLIRFVQILISLASRLETVLLASMHLIVLAALPIAFYQVTPEARLFGRHAGIASFTPWAIELFLESSVILPKASARPKKLDPSPDYNFIRHSQSCGQCSGFIFR